MASETDIANYALTVLGETRITGLTDGSRNADALNGVYEQVRDALLRAHPWNFCVRRQALARLAAAPVSEFDHQFAVPPDFERVLVVSSSDHGRTNVEYRIEYDATTDSRVLLASSTELYLVYVAKVTNPAAWPPDFREALAYALAAAVALLLTNSSALAERMSDGAASRFHAARAADGVENMPEQRDQGSWVGARGGWWGWNAPWRG